MARDRKSVYDLAVLASRLEEARRGKGFESFEYHEVESVLHSAIPISPQIPKSERGRIIGKAIGHAARSTPLSASALKAGIRQAEREFLATPLFRAVLVAPVSIALPSSLTKKTAAGGRVTLARYIPAAFRKERESEALRIPEADRQHAGYSWFLARYKGRSTNEAYEVTLRNADLARAFWNYSFNRRTLIRFSSGLPQPVNRIRLGRAHTLHAPGGRSLMEGYWDEHSFVEARSTSVTATEWKGLELTQRILQSRLSKHPYRAVLENAWVRYVRALDATDLEVAFLKLWALLEGLTATHNAQYDVMIRRTLFLFADREFTRHVLEHLRDQRNSSVHEDAGLDQAHTFVFQLKRHVEQLLAFHMNAGRRYGTIQEACHLLDQPTGRTDLMKRIQYARRAMAFLG